VTARYDSRKVLGERLLVLRTWGEPSEKGSVWRASLRDAATDNRRYFSTPEDLICFLLVELGAARNLASAAEIAPR
jgi:hypothetical protein